MGVFWVEIASGGDAGGKTGYGVTFTPWFDKGVELFSPVDMVGYGAPWLGKGEVGLLGPVGYGAPVFGNLETSS